MVVVNGGQSEVKRKSTQRVVERIAYRDAATDAGVLPPLSVTLYR